MKDEIKKAHQFAAEDYAQRTKSVTILMRLIGFGLLASYYTLRGEVSGSGDWLAIRLHTGVGVAAILTILFEYLQSILAEKVASDAMDNPENILKIYEESRTQGLVKVMYALKQFTAASGAALLVFLILYV